MPFLQKRVAQSASAVAHVSPDVVEWVEVGPNGVLHASVTPESSDPVELASAVHRARKEAGSKTRRCVLALGKAFAPDRILDLPRQLTKKELRGLLERKATSLLMSDEEGAAEPTALFHSWSSGKMAERVRTPAGTWSRWTSTWSRRSASRCAAEATVCNTSRRCSSHRSPPQSI